MNKNDLFIVEKTPVLNLNEKDVADLLKERLSNELSQIDWNYWNKLPFWNAKEAICLLELTDPDRFRIEGSLHSSHTEKLKKLVTQAEREQLLDSKFRNVSPINWIKWAQDKGLDIPTQFNEIIVMSEKGKLLLKEGKDVIGLIIKGAQYVISSASGGNFTTNKESYEVIKIDFNVLLEKGRYTLNDAALTIQEGANSPAKEMLKKLMLAAEDGSLKMYHHNNDSRYLYGEDFNTRVKDSYEVTTLTELNNWLDANEPLIKWRFPKANSLEQLSTNEASNNHVIKGEPKTVRLNNLYGEIVNNIGSYKEIPKHKIIEHLKDLAGKKGSCIQSVDTNINWLDRQGFPQETKFSSLGKWLSRQK